MNCLNCGRELNNKHSLKTKYCSEECYKLGYYKNHKEERKKYQREYSKYIKYANEKGKEQRRVRYIKRRTRQIFSIEGHYCEFCGKKATERHHYTEPIEIDKFNFVCHECHQIQNRIKKEKEVKQ